MWNKSWLRYFAQTFGNTFDDTNIIWYFVWYGLWMPHLSLGLDYWHPLQIPCFCCRSFRPSESIDYSVSFSLSLSWYFFLFPLLCLFLTLVHHFLWDSTSLSSASPICLLMPHGLWEKERRCAISLSISFIWKFSCCLLHFFHFRTALLFRHVASV